MKRHELTAIGFIVGAAVALFAVQDAFAQKGKGDAEGVARKAEKPEVVEISGKLKRVKIGPCESTTGRAEEGVHLLLRDENENEINLHLAPKQVVGPVVKEIRISQKVTARAFQTEKCGEHEYIAQRFTFNDKTYRLRDKTLRPYWAGSLLSPVVLPDFRPAREKARREASKQRAPSTGASYIHIEKHHYVPGYHSFLSCSPRYRLRYHTSPYFSFRSFRHGYGPRGFGYRYHRRSHIGGGLFLGGKSGDVHWGIGLSSGPTYRRHRSRSFSFSIGGRHGGFRSRHKYGRHGRHH